jgi:adsorption protein B
MAFPEFDLAMQSLMQPVAWAIFANQLDELFMDANYLLRGLHRKHHRVVPEQDLRSVEQKRIAILLPAWRESQVIERMLEHNLGSVDYDRDRYDFFCGTYQNDPDTQGCVDRLARSVRGVHKVVVPHDGPTSKADCLNWVYQGLLLSERKRGIRYDILLMHDAEDIIHPLALRLYSLLIPRYEFVQTPVFSLQLKRSQFVAGTYIDEFAEHHLKEMKVRQAIGGLVPSAGVGSAFERNAFEEIALSHQQQPFNPSSLTEDYEIGLKFRLAQKRVCFACHTIERDVTVQRGVFRKRPVVAKQEEYIATREYFPAGFKASVRQRSRWILGITLQTWEQMGWQGTLTVLYCLWRDRKGLLNNLLLVVAYALAAWILCRSADAAVPDMAWTAVGPDPAGHALSLLLAFNVGALLWRSLFKMQFVRRLYGAKHSWFVLPRLVLANLIGILATARAVRMYVRHRITGQPLRWLKTAHAFPNLDALSEPHATGDATVEPEPVPDAEPVAAPDLGTLAVVPVAQLLAVSGKACTPPCGGTQP